MSSRPVSEGSFMSMSSRPLSEGNWLQRRYARWAQPHYERMAPELRQEVERYDHWMYSRQGLWFWAGLLLTVAASVAGLMLWVRMSAVPALVLVLIFWGSTLLTLMHAWLKPEQFVWSGRMTWAKWTHGAFTEVLGMLVGVLVVFPVLLLASSAVSGDLGKLLDGQRLLNTFWRGLPWMIGALAVMGLITGAVAHLSRWRLQIQMRSLRLAAERNAAAREAAEARLKLLQAQIHPHFIFNTLSAVQYWVDQGDPRGGPLLRTLTAFLRGCTDMMERDRVPLAQELTMVGHYLDLMQARLGARLRCRIQTMPGHEGYELPPGLLLTLVENAVEHAVEPSLHGGEIEVRVQVLDGNLCIDIQDDGPGLDANAADGVGEGVGLRNTRARLAQSFGARATLELSSPPGPPAPAAHGCRARIRLPLD
jgi:hypothetical protein